MKGIKVFKKPAALLLSAVMTASAAFGSATVNSADVAKAETPGVALNSADFLTASGKNLVNANGELVQLKGTNVGGWFVQEFWMTITNATTNVHAQVDIDRVLEERFGKDGMMEILNAYMDSYITEADLDKMADLGVNCIRAPFWWRTIADENGTLYADAFDRLDWLVKEAGNRGMYVIIDFHGAPGSQNGSDHSGVDGQDDKQGASHFFWGEDAASNQEMYYQLWEQIASHYKGNPVVAGYDLLNEPYCTYRYNTDMEENDLLTMLWDIYDNAYDRIREIDPDHVVIMEATWDPADLPNPAAYDWQNVMYEYHNYLYDDYDNANGGQITNMETKVNSIATADYNVPSFMGVFCYFNNVDVWDQGLQLLAESGLNFTTWTYKTISDYGNWGLVHQENAGVDLEKDSFETILAAYQNAGTTSDNTDLQPVAEKWFKSPDVENTLSPIYAEIADGTYYFRGNHSNKVVEATEDGLVHGGSSAFIADDNQLITVTNVGENEVILQSGTGKYFTVDADGILRATADDAADAERFIPVAASSVTTGFRSTTTYKFVCMDENYEDYRLVADRNGTGSWETFYLNDPTVITIETYSGWTRYEAESADTLGGQVESQDFYSAKKGIGSMNTGVAEADIADDLSNIKYVAFHVTAPKAGTYRALVGYNGDDDKQIVVKINDNPYEVVNVPAVNSDHAWNAMHELYLELDLAEGDNTVIVSGTINNPSTWMNVDYIDIANYLITITEDGAELYESETFRSNGTVEAQSFYSNGVGYGNMNSNCEYENLAADFSNAKYVDYTVYVDEAGTYDITWAYNGESYDNMPAAYKVNGGDKQPLTLNNAASGAWNVMNSVTFTADLNVGLNDILVSGTLSSYNNWANADYILVAPHEAVTTTRYEAEGAVLHNGITVTTDNADNCSEGAAAGSTENQIGLADFAEDWSNAKYAEFTVEAPKKGTYGLLIAYYGDDDKTVAYQVNGKNAVELSVPNVQEDHAWNAIHTVVANIELEAGTNTILLSGILNGQGWINYDYIEIGETFEIKEEEPVLTHVRYESEGAVLHNVNITDDNSGKCSGGQAVGNTENSIGINDIAEDWSNVKYVDYMVTVDTDGIYEVILAYYGDDDKTIAYKVNDGEKTELALPRLGDGSWDTIHKVPVQMQLKAGENHITTSGILNGTGWVNFDYIDVSIAEEIPYEEPVELDYTALEAAIVAAEATNPDLYTEDSLAVLRAALAQAYAAKDASAQEEIDGAAESLISAIEALVLAEPETEPEETTPEETSVEETSQEETSAEETSAEETSAEKSVHRDFLCSI